MRYQHLVTEDQLLDMVKDHTSWWTRLWSSRKEQLELGKSLMLVRLRMNGISPEALQYKGHTVNARRDKYGKKSFQELQHLEYDPELTNYDTIHKALNTKVEL